jgi:hypothetical protein
MADTDPTIPVALTQRSFAENRQALVDAIRAANPTKWNSFFGSEIGTILIDAIAADNEILSFMLDLRGRESFISTLAHWESLLHHASLVGYSPRRASAATLEVRAETASPVSGQVRISRGTKIRSNNGVPFEVTRDTYIAPGFSTPVELVSGYGDIVGTDLDSEGQTVQVEALVKMTRDSSEVILVNRDGIRFASGVDFGDLVGPGHILKLGNQWLGSGFGDPPDTSRDEFAVISVDKRSTDLQERTVLWMDRAWDLPDWTGKWTLENRNLPLVQGETVTETRSVEGNRTSYTLTCSYHPVLTGDPTIDPLPSGFFRAMFLQPLQSGVEVLVNGIRWEEVGLLITATPESQVYTVTFDELERAVITFGDGVHGAILPEGANLTISYRIGGGVIGNVQQGGLDSSLPIEDGASGTTLFLSNPYTVGSGGSDRETLAEATSNLVQFTRTNDRGVHETDYSSLASGFTDPSSGRVRLAKAVLHSNAVPRENNIVWIYCWSEGPNGQLVAPGATLKRVLLEYLNARKMIGDEIVIVDGISTPVLLHLNYRYHARFSGQEAALQVATAINSVFAAQTPGQPLLHSKLYEAVEATEAVAEATFAHPFENIAAQSDFQLFSSSITNGSRTTLSAAITPSSTVVPVTNPNLFVAGGLISILELNKRPTLAFVEAVNGSNLTLKAAFPSDFYSTDAIVLNSDYFARGWGYEKPLNLYIEFTSSIGDQTLLTRQLRKIISDYFTYVLGPGEVVYRSTVLAVAASVSNISGVAVYFGALSSSIDSISPSGEEKVVLKSLTINGSTS